MRVIFYILDGISALKVHSCNSESVNKANHTAGPTFIDEILKQGFFVPNCYGYDSTQASSYALYTGYNHHRSSISITYNADKFFDLDQNLIQSFKNKGFKTHYFTNSYRFNPALILKGFDEVNFEYNAYDFNELLSSENYKDLFGLSSIEEDLFLVVHDFFTHDQKGAYEQGKLDLTNDEYNSLVVEHADVLKNNLEALKFDKNGDYLILFSDHGLTVDFHRFENPILKPKLWSLPSKELKSRTFASIIGPDIQPKIYPNTCALVDLFPTLSNLFDLPYKETDGEDLLNQPKRDYALSMNIGNGARKRPSQIHFHQFMCVVGRMKWIYQDNLALQVEFYDLEQDPLEEDPQLIPLSSTPEIFRKYIHEYQQSRKWSIHAIHSWMLLNFRISALKFYCKRLFSKMLKLLNLRMHNASQKK